MKPGLPLDEAKAAAGKLDKQISSLLQKKGA